ncbi:MAG: GDP-mannose 4,6-dehydratase [Dehalococcoidia bacterium]
MKILITGITGFVGSHLVDHLLEHQPGVEVFGIKRWRSPMDNLEGTQDRVYLYDCDLRDLSAVMTALREISPDIIFHLAAQSYVPFSYTNPADTLTTNVIGTANLLEAVRLIGLDPLIHICSSSEVYGQVLPEDVPIDEDTPLRPVSPYGVSKVGEDMLGLQYFIAWRLKVIRTRMFTHTGPRRGQVFVASDFAHQVACIEAGLQKPVVRVGNLESVRTFADVRDTVRAYWIMTECFLKGTIHAGDVFNIGGDRTMKVGEMLDFLISRSAAAEWIRVEVDPKRLRPADVTLQIPDVSRFKAATGWKPEIPFETTMEDLLNYWRERTAPGAPRPPRVAEGPRMARERRGAL